MGITPITNLMPLSIARSGKAENEPQPMERVDRSARAGDESYSPSGEGSERGSEDGSGEENAFEEELPNAVEEMDPQSAGEAGDSVTATGINLFA